MLSSNERSGGDFSSATMRIFSGWSCGERRSPQTNGICERFHKTILEEFYRVVFRKKLFRTLEQLQADLDSWVRYYNLERPHQGRWCYGKTPMQTFIDSLPIAKEKQLAA
jgi:transposase InsO family protein